MKQILLSAIVFLSLFTFGQQKDDYEGVLYVSADLGPTIPMGKWGADPESNALITDPFRGRTGLGAGLGFHFKMGQSVPFNLHPEKYFFGFRWGVEYNYNGRLNWDKTLPTAGLIDETTCLYIGGELRPQFSYLIGTTGVLEFGLGLSMPFYLQNAGIQNSLIEIEENKDARRYVAADRWNVGFTPSIAYRRNSLRFGLEFYRQRVQRFYTITEYDYNGKELSQEGFTSDYHISCLRITIGYIFKKSVV